MEDLSLQNELTMTNHPGAGILIVDDEQLVRWSLENELRRVGFSTSTAASGEEALLAVKTNEPDIVLLDIMMPGMDGMEVLAEIRKSGATSMVLMLSALVDLRYAVEAVRNGAYDYIPKPFDLDDVILRIEKALNHRRLEQEVQRFRSQQTHSHGLENVVAVSAPMQEVINTVLRVAEQGNSTVLIQGETGVGKDLIAHAIHTLSPRAKNPFVEINCPSFPAHLLESELFGHEKGAFTDARNKKEGLLEIAHKGTAFLNEIGDIELTVQAKLLQFLERKVIRRIGSTKERQVDVRIIVATNRNLDQAVKEGNFRQDLFFRLNVIPIYIPPLRERVEDIPVLIEHFLEQFRQEMSKPNLDVKPDAVEVLKRYAWPGNVRELRNCLERAVLLGAPGLITVHSLPVEILRQQKPLSTPLSSSTWSSDECTTEVEETLSTQNSTLADDQSPLIEQEKRLIIQALDKASWNQSQAARILRISRDTLRYRMKKYQITPTLAV